MGADQHLSLHRRRPPRRGVGPDGHLRLPAPARCGHVGAPDLVAHPGRRYVTAIVMASGLRATATRQLRAVAAAAGGRDVLTVLPTGGGKSAIYELGGLIGDAPTVVVSPLIALQDDQLAHLRAAGLRPDRSA